MQKKFQALKIDQWVEALDETEILKYSLRRMIEQFGRTCPDCKLL